MKFILDTNCYISFLNTRNKEQHEKMVTFWEKLSKLEYEVFLLSHNISEMVFVFKGVYKLQDKMIRQMIFDLLQHPGIHYSHGYFPETILSYWPDPIKDYGDAVIASACKSLGGGIITFDQDLKKQLKKTDLTFHLL